MLIIASLIAVAVAGPVAPGIPGPAPVVEESPISVGPAIIDAFEQVPISVGPAIIDGFELAPIIISGPDGTPLIQIILNINAAAAEVIPSPAETPVVPEVIIPGPVNIVDNVDAEIVPEPVEIGTPILPEVVVPGPVNIVDNVIAPEPVIIGTPVVVEPVVVGTPIVAGAVNVVDHP